MSNNAHELSNRLLNALDTNYNVVDMPTVIEVVSKLEKFNITKELLETTRLGKHVNELRRKTKDPSLARRAKVLVKRWRDLVIPSAGSPGQSGSNRSSAERQVRLGRIGGTPLTSPALTTLVSPAVCSPKPVSRPAWGGYESDSQDVILVDDDAVSPPTIMSSSNAVTILDDKTAKRDKKAKKKRGHSRAGSETGATWVSRNGGASPPAPRRNGCKRAPVDAYTALVNRIPAVGAKKVKTTKELLRDIQSRGSRPLSPHSPHSVGSANSPEIMLVDTPSPNPPSSPLRNGDATPPPAPSPLPPLEDEREYADCTCEEIANEYCPAARDPTLRPRDVHSLHNAYLPGINGTRAPTYPHQFAVRKLTDPDRPELFNSVVPLYKYSDYADDFCCKNMSRVPLCTHLPCSEWAPSPLPLPRPDTPPTPRPYPIEEEVEIKQEIKEEEDNNTEESIELKIFPMDISIPRLEDSDRLKPPLLSPDERSESDADKVTITSDKVSVESVSEFESEVPEHRTVERTKVELDGRTLYKLCTDAREAVPYRYQQVDSTPLLSHPAPEEVVETAFASAEENTERDEHGRPLRPTNFTEWHECARLGDLIALPYVVID